MCGMSEMELDVASTRNNCLGMTSPILALVDILCELWGGCTRITCMGRGGVGLVGGTETKVDLVGLAADVAGLVSVRSEGDAVSSEPTSVECEEV